MVKEGRLVPSLSDSSLQSSQYYFVLCSQLVQLKERRNRVVSFSRFVIAWKKRCGRLAARSVRYDTLSTYTPCSLSLSLFLRLRLLSTWWNRSSSIVTFTSPRNISSFDLNGNGEDEHGNGFRLLPCPPPPSFSRFYELLYNDPLLSSFRICSASVEDNSGIEVAEDINGSSEDF